jgi:hypothetical protein
MAYEQKIDWKNDARTIEREDMSAAQMEAYDRYKEAYALMKQAKEVFEGRMSEDAPKGKQMLFSYNFGRLKVALIDGTAERKADKPKQTLAEWLREQAQR